MASKKGDINELLQAISNETGMPDENIRIIQNYLGEYLKAYFLVGYDNTGQSIIILNAKSDQDYDSIECAINRFQGIRLPIPNPGIDNISDSQILDDE